MTVAMEVEASSTFLAPSADVLCEVLGLSERSGTGSAYYKHVVAVASTIGLRRVSLNRHLPIAEGLITRALKQSNR